MSYFLTQIEEIFENKIPIKRGSLYFDETFRFKKDDTIEQYQYNCFISTKDMKKTYDLFKSSFLREYTNQWVFYDYDYWEYEITNQDIIEGYKIYQKYGGAQSLENWKGDWKNLW